MVPQKVLGVEQLPDVLYSDYGSLHISRVATVRNDKLRKLTEKPKIDIETIKVSRRVLCIEEVDYSSFKRKNTTDKPEVEVKPRGRIVSRRIGAAAERPPKPKSFIEILTTTVHYDFFKRFMAIHKMSTPLMFWRAVEDLKDLSNSSTRQIRVSQIIRKYPMYMETYPAESGNSSPDRIRLSPLRPTANNVTPDFANLLATWRSLTSSLVDFNRGVSSKQMSQLFEIFLKCEVEREQTNINPDQHLLNSQLQNIEKNAMPSGYVTNVQTRVVIRHRLVILNRLPSDLRFWTEVKKFQDLTDTMMSRGSVSAQDTEFLCDKIRSIISCYLASEVSPRVQINVPSDLALNIINSLASSGPTRGIFHDAIILLFPVLYHYYGR
ncbi:RGSL-like protein [Mya arenaria]|uniref:RGSL-like protein n=1 Tax=Mya arenaria TaxID=6604 RepID=A0ABY7ERK8_MYAAR|nr:RGSL-like protein [Mya arenaria]